MTYPTELPQTPDDYRSPADTDHPAANPAVHIPVEQYRTRTQNRFLKHIEPTEDGCWEWTASRFDTGYGQFRDGGTMREAHRVAYWLFALDDVADDDLVRHKCPEHTLSCCNPAHLTTGTYRDNWLDAVEDGDIDLRFTPAKIREIRRRYQLEDCRRVSSERSSTCPRFKSVGSSGGKIMTLSRTASVTYRQDVGKTES